MTLPLLWLMYCSHLWWMSSPLPRLMSSPLTSEMSSTLQRPFSIADASPFSMNNLSSSSKADVPLSSWTDVSLSSRTDVFTTSKTNNLSSSRTDVSLTSGTYMSFPVQRLISLPAFQDWWCFPLHLDTSFTARPPSPVFTPAQSFDSSKNGELSSADLCSILHSWSGTLHYNVNPYLLPSWPPRIMPLPPCFILHRSSKTNAAFSIRD